MYTRNRPDNTFYPPTTVLRFNNDGRTVVPISITGKGIQFLPDQDGATYAEQSGMVTLDPGITEFRLKHQDTVERERALTGYRRVVDLDELPAFVLPHEMADLDAQWEHVDAMYESIHQNKDVTHKGEVFTVDISNARVVAVDRDEVPPVGSHEWSVRLEYYDVPRVWQGILPGALGDNAAAFKQEVEADDRVRSVRIVKGRNCDYDTAVVEFKSAFDDGRYEMVKPLFGRSKKLVKSTRYETFTTTFSIPHRIFADNVDEAMAARDKIIRDALAEVKSPRPCETCDGRGFVLGDRFKLVK